MAETKNTHERDECAGCALQRVNLKILLELPRQTLESPIPSAFSVAACGRIRA